jgi:cyclic-di-AMP phosphodiesterase PgpH
MASIYSLRELSQRSQLLRSALIVVITYTILYFALDLIHVNDIAQLNTYMYVNFIINGILLLFTYPLRQFAKAVDAGHTGYCLQ